MFLQTQEYHDAWGKAFDQYKIDTMELKFKISDFNISGEPIPEDVADKILVHHILDMQKVRAILNIPIWPSEKSGYRSKEWEIARGRSGTSQHTFTGLGATDWTCEDFSNTGTTLLESIKKNTAYTRMAVYSTFIHCDYKPTASGKRQIFDSNASSQWTIREEF